MQKIFSSSDAKQCAGFVFQHEQDLKPQESSSKVGWSYKWQYAHSTAMILLFFLLRGSLSWWLISTQTVQI